MTVLDYAAVKLALIGKSTGSASQLLKTAAHPWLEPFAVTFDDHISEYVRDFAGKHDNPYDPFPVEFLLTDIATLLDRCQLYRREIYELEAAAVRQALDYELFRQQQPILFQLDEAASFERQRAIEKKAHEQAASDFSKSNDTLAPGFATIASGTALAAQETITGEHVRKKLLTQKYEFLQQYQDALQTRHRSDGNALNFGERLGRMLAFVQSDIQTAYLKAEAAAIGLDRAFGINSLPLPRADEPKLLDKLVLWARRMAEDLSIAGQAELEFERILSVRQLVGDDTYIKTLQEALKEPEPFEEPDDGFDDKLGHHELPPKNPKPVQPASTTRPVFSFQLESKHFTHRPVASEPYRLKGIGASFHASEYDQPKARLWRLTTAIFTPVSDVTTGPFARLAQYRPPVILSNVALTDPRSPVTPVLSIAARNIDPRGFWQVCVSSKVGVPHNQAPKDINANEIYDINLHLVIATARREAPTYWEHFRW